MTEKCIIAAVADDMAIGVSNRMPWHLSADLKYFKAVTLGCPVIMGRGTFLSLGSKSLPGRRNIVLSRNMGVIPGVEVAASLEEAYGMVRNDSKCFVIGGASVYSQAVDTADKLYLTRVHMLVPDADAFFPRIDPAIWTRETVSETFSESGVDFEFEVYAKRKALENNEQRTCET